MLRDRRTGILLTRAALPRKATVRGQALALILEGRSTRAAQDGRKAKVLGLTPSLVLPVLLLLAVSAGAQSAAQCREANEQAIAAFKATLPEMPEHDRASAEALIDELERLIKDSRAQGVDECVIWQEINRRVWRS
jgi:hypothetical protein